MLRPYQASALEACRGAYRRGARGVCLVMPTGSGKTVTGGEAVVGAHRNGSRVLWLADRRELVDQATESLRRLGLEVGVIMSGAFENPRAPVLVALVDTLRARPGMMPDAVGFAVLDECHMGLSNKWLSALEPYPEAKRLGLTATPERSDGSALGNIFEALVEGPSIAELEAQGHLVPCTVLDPGRADGTLARDPVDAYLELGEGRPGFLFLKTRDASREAAERLQAAGVKAVHVDGSTAKSQRKDWVRRFRSGAIDVLCNVEVFTKGFDAPRASVAVLGRPTKLNCVYLQQVGRVLRPAPGKDDALIIDLVGATTVLGHPSAPREYSLQGEPIKLRDGPIERTTTCRKCFAMYKPRPACPRCGHVNPAPEIEVVEKTLRKVDRSWLGRNMPVEQKIKTYLRYRKEADEKGHKPRAAWMRFRGTFGEDPPAEALSARLREVLK